MNALERTKNSIAELLKEEWRNIIIGIAVGASLASLVPSAVGCCRGISMWWTQGDWTKTNIDSRILPVAFVAVVLAAIILWLLPILVKWIRSFRSGAIRGLFVLPMLTTFVVVAFPDLATWKSVGSEMTNPFTVVPWTIWGRLGLSVLLVVAIVAWVSRLRPRPVANRDEISPGDDSCRSIRQDRFGWDERVSEIANRIINEGKPTYAIYGEFGSGKSSMLNFVAEYLRDRENDRTIIVRFNGWLPGSREDLAEHLLGDIAAECSKQYLVPGLNRTALRLSRTLATYVPHMKWLTEFLPQETQQNVIEDAKRLLDRLPKRVVVLIDEIDRMRKDELLALLKVIRGCAPLTNITFVCAMERETIENLICKDYEDARHILFQKFFAGSFWLPKLDSAFLKAEMTEVLATALAEQGWFNADQYARKEYTNALHGYWDSALAYFCTNLRAITRLENSIRNTTRPLVGEVNPVDLTLLAVLQQFAPNIYELVWTFRDTLTSTGTLWTSDDFQKDFRTRVMSYHEQEKSISEKIQLQEQVAAVRNSLFSGLDRIIRENEKSLPTEQIRTENARSLADHSYLEKNDKASEQKRLRSPSFFPAYFQGKLKSSIFAEAKMSDFIERVRTAKHAAECGQILRDELEELKDAPERRLNLLRKLTDKAHLIEVPEALRAIALAAVQYKQVDERTRERDDERAQIARLVSGIADLLEINNGPAPRVEILKQCIDQAASDEVSQRILVQATRPVPPYSFALKSKGLSPVPDQDLFPVFLHHMEKSYGPDAVVANIRLELAYPPAFYDWASIAQSGKWCCEDKKTIALDFWRRYLDSRERLADFSKYILTFYVYADSVNIYPDALFPTSELRELLRKFPNEDGVSEEIRGYLGFMEHALGQDAEISELLDEPRIGAGGAALPMPNGAE